MNKLLRYLKPLLLTALISYPSIAQAIPGADPRISGTGGIPNFTSLFTADNTGLLDVIIKILQLAAGVTAVLFIVISGYLYITSHGDEGQVTKAKNSLIYSVIGLLVVIFSEAIPAVLRSKQTDGTYKINVSEAVVYIIGFTNLLLSFVGAIAVLIIIYAGFLWITAHGDEGQAGTAKKALSFAVVGLIVIIFSKAIVTILITMGGAGDGGLPDIPFI